MIAIDIAKQRVNTEFSRSAMSTFEYDSNVPVTVCPLSVRRGRKDPSVPVHKVPCTNETELFPHPTTLACERNAGQKGPMCNKSLGVPF